MPSAPPGGDVLGNADFDNSLARFILNHKVTARNEPVKNLELWKTLDGQRAFHEIKAHWIRGHDDHPENDRCDELAVAAAARFERV